MVLHSCPVFVFFYFLNAKCWRAWLRRPAKILADKDCCQRLLPNLHPEIRNMHLAQTSNNSTSKSYRKIWLGNKSFSRTKNYNTQFIYTIYRGMPHLCADLNALNDQNVIFLRAFVNSDHQGPYIVGLQARGLAPIFRSFLRLGPYISTATVHRFLLLK